MKNLLNTTWQVVVLVLAATAFLPCNAAPADEQFENLLQMNGDNLTMPTNSYSGYLKIDEEKQLHYVFIESESQPTTDPILVWFNGGPGCSSMLAFMQEHGPWVIEDEAVNVTKNPYPWNANASVIYLESPAGVGFSPWKVNGSERFYNDMYQSEDAYAALKQWYLKFPEYGPGKQNNPLFISGESYGGIYTPYLAWQIYQNNQMAKMWHFFDDDHIQINLKGFIVGNGATDWTFDVQPVFPELAKYFNLIPESVYKQWTDHECTFFFNGTVHYNDSNSNYSTCFGIWQEILDNTASLNWYDLYRKNFTIEPSNNTTDFWGNPLEDPRYGKAVLKDGREVTYKRGYSFLDYMGGWAKRLLGRDDGDQQDVGIGAKVLSDYLNNQNVKDILHINNDSLYYNNDSHWEACNEDIGNNWHFQNEASLWIYRVFYHQPDIKMLFFSGDTDGAVPALGTRKWLEKLNWEIKKPWRPWVHGGQVQGYIEHYRGHLDFATVRGVGHMAPQWKRAPMQYLITQWIHGANIDVLDEPVPDPDLIEW